MRYALVLFASLASTSAFATPHVMEFNILSCPTAPSNIGFLYSDPLGHTDFEGLNGERFYASCSSRRSPSLSVDVQGNDTAFTITNTTSRVLVIDSLQVEAAPGPLGPLLGSLTIEAGGESIVIDPYAGPTTQTFEAFRGLRPGEAVTFSADGAWLFDDLSYDLEIDADGDGYVPAEGDCDDLDAESYPGADDIPGDGIDQDCDGVDAQLDFRALAVMPSCPAAGPLHIVWSGGTPAGRVQILPGTPGSPPSIWNGTECSGRLLGVTPIATPPPRTSGVNGSGYFGLPTAASTVCGFEIQLLDLDSCTLSPVLIAE